MTIKDEALALALEALEKVIGYTENWPASFTAHDCWKRDKVSALHAITAIKQAQQAQEPVESRSLTLAKQQWESWKQYALELQERLVKYEGGAPMVLNANEPAPKQAQEPVDMPDCWVVVKDGQIIGTHDEPCVFDGIEGVRYVPAPKQAEPKPRTIDLGRYAGTYGGTLPTPPEAKA